MEMRKYFESEIETMNREKLEALQLRRLKLQLKRCYENSEFYKGKFALGGHRAQGYSIALGCGPSSFCDEGRATG